MLEADAARGQADLGREGAADGAEDVAAAQLLRLPADRAALGDDVGEFEIVVADQGGFGRGQAIGFARIADRLDAQLAAGGGFGAFSKLTPYQRGRKRSGCYGWKADIARLVGFPFSTV